MRKRLLKVILLIITVFLAFFFFTKSVKSFLNTYPTFKIKKIEIRRTFTPLNPPMAERQKPLFNGASAARFTPEEIRKKLNIDEQTSIFSLNLKQASRRLEKEPEIKKAIVIRQLPDKLIIQLEERRAVAQIGTNRYFLVDEQGVILPEPRNFPFADFPLIEGINFQLSEIRIGKKYISQNLNDGLSLIKFLSSFDEFEVKKVNVKDIKNVFFYLQVNKPNLPTWSGKTLLIKIRNVPQDKEARDSLAEKLGLLDEILSLHSPQDVRYIDLRFRDVIVNSRISTNR